MCPITAFVCDGYSGNGKFHINWGWSGLSNGDFALTTSLNKPETATKDELTAAATTITNKVEEARTDIARIQQEEEMSEQEKETFHNAQLSDLVNPLPPTFPSGCR